MAYLVEDEHGTVWHVGKGDPAYPLVQKLRKADYTWVVLPRLTIIDGVLPVEVHDNGEGRPEVLRLIECVEVLHGNSVIN